MPPPRMFSVDIYPKQPSACATVQKPRFSPPGASRRLPNPYGYRIVATAKT